MSSTGTAPTTPTTTIGTQIDAFLDQFDQLSSTQLYVLIVSLTFLISFLLLGNTPETKSSSSSSCLQMKKTPTTETAKNKLNNNNNNTQPEPSWQYFHYFNYLMIGAFLYSVIDFGWNAQHYYSNQSSNTILLRFLTAWSLFLVYFFAFFGVSFVHDDLNTTTTTTTTATASSSSEQAIMEKQQQPQQEPETEASLSKKKGIHPPAHSTQPLCSDHPVKPTKQQTALLVPSHKTKLSVDASSDDDFAQMVLSNQMKDHELEKKLDPFRAVAVRRRVTAYKLASLTNTNEQAAAALENLPHLHPDVMDYSRVYGANCESVIGYIPLPVGIVGPLTINDQTFYVPMATTEGCLVASTNRGAKAITAGGGAYCEIVKDGITRAPCVRLSTARRAAHLKVWCEQPDNFQKLKQAFESTTSFGKLLNCQATIAGKNVYLRLVCFSGDAMGMNMVSKGSLAVIDLLRNMFDDLQLVALSGNMCTDKKAAATNWLEGRGKSVVAEATIPKEIVKTVLKTTVKSVVETNLHKNLIGSAMAGAMGGFNAHAANIVTAVFLATGQDPAQNVESSNCITLMEETDSGDLWISCTMPSLEVGTVGGGTSLPAQAACLKIIGCQGGSINGNEPGTNAKTLAKAVAAMTMAGELSLLAALAANTLVQAHMTHNRKK